MAPERQSVMLRLFIALELPPEVHATLSIAQAALADQGLRVRWVDPAGAHLTLKFLGATRPEQVVPISFALRRAVAAFEPFDLRTTRLGVFPDPRAPRVVWLGIMGDLNRLDALQRAVEAAIAPLGFPTERRGFKPHLTLGRVIKDAPRVEVLRVGQAVAASRPVPAAHWRVSRVSLMRSDLQPGGARYTRVADGELGGAEEAG
jgi:RNA 2',3'-cyclic 3'-phosphodiesterase